LKMKRREMIFMTSLFTLYRPNALSLRLEALSQINCFDNYKRRINQFYPANHVINESQSQRIE
jgi:hypothetical protein